MTPSNPSLPAALENEEWNVVRKVLTETHNAIRKAREVAIPRRWYERDEVSLVSAIATFVCFVVSISIPRDVTSDTIMLATVVVGPFMTYAFRTEVASWEQKRDRMCGLPFTDTELQAIASLPISSKTPGYKTWVEAASDHALGLADLKNLIHAIDDYQESERKRRLLQHQNHIIFGDQETGSPIFRE